MPACVPHAIQMPQASENKNIIKMQNDGHTLEQGEEERGGAKKDTSLAALKDLAAGTISGIACKSVEYPFDTVKVRMQMPGESRGPIQILMEGVRKNGLASLYRGIPGPMVGAMGENAILFVVYGRLINGLKYINSSSQEEAHNRMPTMAEYILAGGGAGAAVATLLTPVELIKCRMQMEGSKDLYKNDIDCFIKSTRNEGLGVMFKVLAISILQTRSFHFCASYASAHCLSFSVMSPCIVSLTLGRRWHPVTNNP